MRIARLIFVEHNGNKNKYYNMTDNGSILDCEYGRVGSSKQTAQYPSRDWNKKYNEKINKGYTDITDLHKTVSVEAQYQAIPDYAVNEILDRLLSYSNSHITQNYTVSSESVTLMQINKAQSVINLLSRMIQDDFDLGQFNLNLMTLFQVIPRRMGKVADYIVSNNSENIIESAKQIITSEQDTLDTMATKVSMNIPESSDSAKITLLDALGISMRETTKEEQKTIIKSLGGCANKYSKSFAVSNSTSDAKFDNSIGNRELLFHGSRNENFISILKTGLLIRPSSAAFNGAMFGSGIYFADKASKSLGYTSLRGSYWAKGSAGTGYMAIFETSLGNQKHIHRHDSSCYRLSDSVLKKDGFDSVFAHGGADLRNNEFIVYMPEQCRIKYLVELT